MRSFSPRRTRRSTGTLRTTVTHVLGATVAVAGLAAAAPAAQAAPGTTYYVAPTGSDTAAGTAAAPLKTVNAALKLARDGERVQLAPGAYAAVRDENVRTRTVEVAGAGPAQTQVAGLDVFGGQGLTFSGIRFTGQVRLNGHPVKHAAQPAKAITITGSEIVTTNSCLTIKEGSEDITLSNSRLTGCYAGVAGPGNPYVSKRITITGNTIEKSTSDGIQFGAWDDVTITDNVIRDTVDPANTIHNDAIQLTGTSTGVHIERNQLLNSRNQLILIQDAIGPLDDVTVANNLLAGAGSVALQSQGATRARIVNNTIWNAKDGGLWLRKGYLRGGAYVVPTDTVMTNNLTTTIKVMDGAVASTNAGNVMPCPSKTSGITVPAGTSCVADPGFVNAAAGDYRLLPGSAVRSLGSPLGLPPTDLTGALRTVPVPGAYT